MLFAELYALKLDISTKMVAVVEIIRFTAHEQDHILPESEKTMKYEGKYGL